MTDQPDTTLDEDDELENYLEALYDDPQADLMAGARGFLTLTDEERTLLDQFAEEMAQSNAYFVRNAASNAEERRTQYFLFHRESISFGMFLQKLQHERGTFARSPQTGSSTNWSD